MTTRRVREAALRVQLLMEEFSSEELTQALALISGLSGEDLLSYLQRMKAPSRRASVASSSRASLNRNGETRALQEVKTSDFEKYRVLRDFELAIREGRILQDMDEFRSFGNMLDKDFEVGKSRKEAMGRLIAMLSRMDLDSLQSAISRVPSKSKADDGSFRRLANQIMLGPEEEPRNAR